MNARSAHRSIFTSFLHRQVKSKVDLQVWLFGKGWKGDFLLEDSLGLGVSAGGTVGIQSLLIELLLSAFFAIACFRARAEESISLHGLASQRLFMLTDRLERLRRSRWQWFSMVLLLVIVRMQLGTPMVAELTALAQFVLFLALPTQKPASEVLRRR